MKPSFYHSFLHSILQFRFHISHFICSFEFSHVPGDISFLSTYSVTGWEEFQVYTFLVTFSPLISIFTFSRFYTLLTRAFSLRFWNFTFVLSFRWVEFLVRSQSRSWFIRFSVSLCHGADFHSLIHSFLVTIFVWNFILPVYVVRFVSFDLRLRFTFLLVSFCSPPRSTTFRLHSTFILVTTFISDRFSTRCS